MPFKQPRMSDNKEDPACSEWLVGIIKWAKTFDRGQAKCLRISWPIRTSFVD
jgi:hypothetical protein